MILNYPHKKTPDAGRPGTVRGGILLLQPRIVNISQTCIIVKRFLHKKNTGRRTSGYGTGGNVATPASHVKYSTDLYFCQAVIWIKKHRTLGARVWCKAEYCYPSPDLYSKYSTDLYHCQAFSRSEK